MVEIKVSYDDSKDELQWYDGAWMDVGTFKTVYPFMVSLDFLWSRALSDEPVTIKTPSSGGHVPLSETVSITMTLLAGETKGVEFKAKGKTYNGFVSAPKAGGGETVVDPSHSAPPAEPGPLHRVAALLFGGEARAAEEPEECPASNDPEPRT